MTTPTPCLLCHRPLHPTDTRTCVACVGRTRRQLRDVARLHALLPAFLGHPTGAAIGGVFVKATDAPLPGGDALAMLGPGAAGGDGHPSDPPAVAFELWQWTIDWAETRHKPVPATPVEVTVRWLSRRTGWAAAHHQAFDEFTTDLCRITGRLEAVTGMHDRPEHGPPCPYCRTADLLRPYTDAGLADDWACPACRRDFTFAQYVLALRADLERVGVQVG